MILSALSSATTLQSVTKYSSYLRYGRLRPADRTALVIPKALCSNCRQLIYRGRQKCPGIYRTYWTEVVYCFYTFVWRQAYFPETSASEPKGDRLGASWRSTGPCLYDTQFKLGGFVGLVSFWCTTGGATLLGKCRRSHFVCTGQCGCTKVDTNCCIKRYYNSLTLIKNKYYLNIFKEIKRF